MRCGVAASHTSNLKRLGTYIPPSLAGHTQYYTLTLPDAQRATTTASCLDAEHGPDAGAPWAGQRGRARAVVGHGAQEELGELAARVRGHDDRGRVHLARLAADHVADAVRVHLALRAGTKCGCSASAVAPVRLPSQRALTLLRTQGRTAGANGAAGHAVQRTPLVTAFQWRSAPPAQGMLPADTASRRSQNGLAAATRGLAHCCGGPPRQSVGHLAEPRRASTTRPIPAHKQLEDV